MKQIKGDGDLLPTAGQPAEAAATGEIPMTRKSENCTSKTKALPPPRNAVPFKLNREVIIMLSSDYQFKQEQDELQDRYGQEAQELGWQDGEAAYRPQYCNSDYLRGWLIGIEAHLKQLPCDRQGRVQYSSEAPKIGSWEWLEDIGAFLRKELGLPELTPDEEF